MKKLPNLIYRSEGLFILLITSIFLCSCSVNNYTVLHKYEKKGYRTYILDTTDFKKCARLELPYQISLGSTRNFQLVSIDNKEVLYDFPCYIFLPPGEHIIKMHVDYETKVGDGNTTEHGFGTVKITSYYHMATGTTDYSDTCYYKPNQSYVRYNKIEPKDTIGSEMLRIGAWGGLLALTVLLFFSV